ncbi:MAG TPA: hypothetical protein VHM70_29235 [Polyangiaceae bacterium]|jgi:hypothetical protein|nr:hypothetical protein [Polyangiaceae bacterium]
MPAEAESRRMWARQLPNGAAQPNGVLRLNLLITGTYAWLATTAVPAILHGSAVCIVSALGAITCLGVGVALYSRSAAWGRALGMLAFVVLCAFTWITLGSALGPGQLHPIQAASGAAGWVLFAFGWGAVRNARTVPENDPHVIVGKPLAPRTALPRLAYVMFAVSLVGGLVPWLLAWRVERGQHALLAHALGLAIAIAMVSLGAQASVNLQQPTPARSPARRLNGISTTVALLALAAVTGFVVWLVRG